MQDGKGKDVDLSIYKGKVLLVVNVASKWFGPAFSFFSLFHSCSNLGLFCKIDAGLFSNFWYPFDLCMLGLNQWVYGYELYPVD